jgi:hypothetical protein
MKPILSLSLALLLTGCGTLPRSGRAGPAGESELALLRRQLEDIHGSRDAAAFGALHLESAIVEWRGRTAALIGRLAIEENRRESWATRRELRLSLNVTEVRIHDARAYEFGSYEETWVDLHGNQVTDFGRYVTAYARASDGQWRIARTLGFTDVRATKPRVAE